MTTTIANSMENGANFVGPWGGLVSPITAMSWFFLLSIGIVGQPHIVHKFFMVRDTNDLKWGGPTLAAVGGMLAGLLWFGGVGLVIKHLSLSGQLSAESMALLAESADNTIVVFLNNYVPRVIAGVVYAGIASAIMSTADSFINIASAAVVRDLPFSFGKELDSKQELYYGRIAVIILSIIAVILALTLGAQGIALLGAFGWGGTFAAALAPAVGIGFNWKRGGTKEGALWSIIVGLVLNVGLEVAKTLGLPFYANNIGNKGIYNGTLSLAVSIIVYIVVSYMTKAQPLDKEIEALLDA